MINETTQPIVGPQVGDRVSWQHGSMFGTVTAVQPEGTVWVQHDGGQFWHLPAGALHLVAAARLSPQIQPRKKRIVPVVIVGVVAFLFLVALVNGLSGEGTPDTASAPPVVQKAPAPRTAEVSDAKDLQDAVTKAGVVCPESWQSMSTNDVYISACGADVVVSYIDGPGPNRTGSVLVQNYRGQGSFPGDYAVIDEGWAVVVPTSADAEAVQDIIGGSVEAV